ncbi:hypothetical protein [Psychrilyobacter atlanticus]|uniref:hypothetical protein n=1 Tax=Psychrilyobacter atlanticus TaxID=271091 RepID=UPI00048CD7CA|nr:hypothetical protein [Psychrilyobacter atlanticus]
MGKIIVILFLIALIGGYLCLSAYKNDDKFFNLPHQKRTVDIFGRKVARLFYFGFGFAIIVVTSIFIVKIA